MALCYIAAMTYYDGTKRGLMDRPERITFDTKIAVVLRDDLAAWQKLNVTAVPADAFCLVDIAMQGER
jgi:hypothetical protein